MTKKELEQELLKQFDYALETEPQPETGSFIRFTDDNGNKCVFNIEEIESISVNEESDEDFPLVDIVRFDCRPRVARLIDDITFFTVE